MNILMSWGPFLKNSVISYTYNIHDYGISMHLNTLFFVERDSWFSSLGNLPRYLRRLRAIRAIGGVGRQTGLYLRHRKPRGSQARFLPVLVSVWVCVAIVLWSIIIISILYHTVYCIVFYHHIVFIVIYSYQITNGCIFSSDLRVFTGVHSAMLDDDGGRGHIGLHRPVRYPLQAAGIAWRQWDIHVIYSVVFIWVNIDPKTW